MSQIPPSGVPADDQRPPQAIVFNCNQCGRSLRVAPEAAGRQAQCPHCRAVQSVPAEPPRDVAGTPDARASAPQTSPPAAATADTGDFSLGAEDASVAARVSTGAHERTPAPAAVPPVRTTGSPTAGPGPRGVTPSGSAEAPPPPATKLTSDDTAAHTDASETRNTETKRLFDRVTREIAKIYVGQEELVLGTLVALFSSGHVLIESVPGLGKTLFVRTLGRVLGCEFGRIQFTADLMPSDITGAPIFNMKTQEFHFRPGPVFTQFLLADEINRSPAKTHASLLEIMQEYRVTVDGTSHHIERPFLVLATQNPIESEGTYNLPEAQLDRFMLKLVAEYPEAVEEARILDLHSRQVDINKRLEEELQTVTGPAEILEVTRQNGSVRMDPRLIDYINQIVRLTREWPHFHMGASPRAGIALMQGARTLAAFRGRDYATPDDVVQLCLPALRHRVILNAEAEVEGHAVDALLTDLIRSVEVPRI